MTALDFPRSPVVKTDGWEPGEIAIITISRGDVVAMRTATGDWAWVAADGDDAWNGISVCSAAGVRVRSVVTVDPESDDDRDRLVDAICGRGFVHEDGASFDALSDALGDYLNPAWPAPAEPLHPAARVTDRDGDTWARIGDVWCSSRGARGTWDLVTGFAPLTIEGVA